MTSAPTTCFKWGKNGQENIFWTVEICTKNVATQTEATLLQQFIKKKGSDAGCDSRSEKKVYFFLGESQMYTHIHRVIVRSIHSLYIQLSIVHTIV